MVFASTFENMAAGFRGERGGGVDTSVRRDAAHFVDVTVGRETMARWSILYCGGSQLVVDKLKKISEEYGVNLSVEKFDW